MQPEGTLRMLKCSEGVLVWLQPGQLLADSYENSERHRNGSHSYHRAPPALSGSWPLHTNALEGAGPQLEPMNDGLLVSTSKWLQFSEIDALLFMCNGSRLISNVRWRRSHEHLQCKTHII